MTNKNKLFLIDAMAIIYRAHFAFIKNPRMNSKGMNTSAIFGFITAMLDLLDKQKPSHLAVAFDSYEPTMRHEDFSDYKANRDKQPEDITLSIPIIKKLLEAFKVPCLEVPGYEADDIIATLSKQVPSDTFDVYMFTPDKDYAQLVNDHVFLFKPGRMGKGPELWDEAKVKEQFGIKRIDQVVEIQGLMGDAVDNIPGVPGIGPKTAQKLIAEFDNIENLLKNTDKLKGKVKESLEQHADDARNSKILATLLTSAPVEFNADDFVLSEPDKEALAELFAELEFKSLGKKILGFEPERKKANQKDDEIQALFEFDETPESKSIDQRDTNYKVLETDEAIESLFTQLMKAKRFAFEFNLDAASGRDGQINGLALSHKANEAYYIPFSENPGVAKGLLEKIRELFGNREIEKVSYDMKRIMPCLRANGVILSNKLYDNLLAHYLIDAESRHDFEMLTEKYLQYKTSPDLLPGSSNTTQLFCERADLNFQLFAHFETELTSSYKELFYHVESPLLEVLADMEYEGIRVDPDILNSYSHELGTELQALEKEIYNLSGVSFNINSPAQLGHVLFDILKLDPKAKKTKKSKQYSTSEDVLQKLASKHQIVSKVLDYRGIQKLKSTYIDALPTLILPDTGHIHTTFDQAVAATGRLSSKNPNLQNIPIRTERGRYTRKAFVARNDQYALLSADYSQIELRVIAHTSGDENMIDAFNNNLDIHTATAARIFSVDLDKVDSTMRRKAKEVNFGIIYGISSWGLAQRLNISRAEGSEIKEQYFLKYPRIKEYMDACIEKAKKYGYAETILHRKRYLRDINSRSGMQRSFAERNAINAPIQGSAADLIKIAMVRIFEALKKEKAQSKMILQVHDELIFDVAKDELNDVKALVKQHMENAMRLKVPLKVEMGTGANWLEAH